MAGTSWRFCPFNSIILFKMATFSLVLFAEKYLGGRGFPGNPTGH
ncbi:MAG: hypothetical protein Q6354_04080 [Candidatus Brocadiales bacterium]|nr:hypothetical protein [Candidatus Brocadiales bacterium]